MKSGKVYLVGAGPGAVDLITVRGREILRQADVIIYDYLVNKQLLEEAKEGAELICCDKFGRDRYSDGFLIYNEKITETVIKKFKEGKKVMRLKSGDAAIFSRLSQELDSLVREKIEFEVVPGVTAASAASCLSGIPLTDRRFASSCVIVSGHEDPAKKESLLDWQSIAKSGTIVLYMAVERLSKIVEELLRLGKKPDTAAAIIQDVSLLRQKIVIGTLKDIVVKAKAADVMPPAIIIIGQVVGLEKKFNWLKKAKKVLFTGLSNRRYFEKGIVFHFPLIKIEPLKSYKSFDPLLRDIKTYDWIVFSSRYGVQYFFQRLNIIGYDSRRLFNAKIAAVGKSTRDRLLDFGVLADLVPLQESSEGLIKEFSKFNLKNNKIFLPHSNLSDKGLTRYLSSAGAIVTSRVAYTNTMPRYLPDLDFSFFNEIMFTSPSGVRNFMKRYGSLPRQVRIRCIGEVTRREAKRWNYF